LLPSLSPLHNLIYFLYPVNWPGRGVSGEVVSHPPVELSRPGGASMGIGIYHATNRSFILLIPFITGHHPFFNKLGIDIKIILHSFGSCDMMVGG